MISIKFITREFRRLLDVDRFPSHGSKLRVRRRWFDFKPGHVLDSFDLRGLASDTLVPCQCVRREAFQLIMELPNGKQFVVDIDELRNWMALGDWYLQVPAGA